MKKFFAITSIFLILLTNINTLTAVAQPRTYSQGFYAMKDLGLIENTIYNVQNNEPYVEGLLFIIDSDRKIQQLIRIPAGSTKLTLIPLKSDYRFIIYNNIKLSFS